ncbi:MAG: hypothetical protein ACKV1O_24110, partial [Saprospiraceae bacterium]
MSQKTILPFLLCFCLSIQVFAQVNPQFCRVEGAAIAYTPPPPSSTTNDGPYTIKVYVHMCLPTSAIGSNAPEDHHGISATELNAIIATTEEDFEPHNIFFDWCVLYHYSDEDFITSEQYPYTNFIGSYSLNDGINAYILPDNYFDNEGGYSSSSAGGGSSFALANQSALPATNLVIYGQVYECYPAFYPAYDGDHFATIPHVLSHEMGHCLGLFHTHETVTCAELPDGSNSSTCGDLITDTPADPNLRFSVNTSCQWVSHFFPPACTAGPPGYNYIPTPGYSPDLLNIMAYTNYYACKPVFTAGQGVRMRNTIANSPVLA